jgi:hypothetical protein
MDNEQPKTDNPRAKIKPLTSRKADGTRYEREEDVLDCIAHYLGVPESVRISNVPRMPSEVQVYFIRNTERTSHPFYDRLFRELTRRASRVIHESTRGLDPFDAKDLSIQIESRVMQWIVNPNPSPTADLLEIRFAYTIEMMALEALRVYMRSPLGGLRGRPVTQLDDDGDEMERPLELSLAGGPEPEDLLLILDDQERRHELLRKACRALPDRRHLKAAILRWGYDWPITANNWNQRSLTRHFGVSKAQMHRWLESAMTAMRAALMDEPEWRDAQAGRIAEILGAILGVDEVSNDTEIARAAKGGKQ